MVTFINNNKEGYFNIKKIKNEEEFEMKFLICPFLVLMGGNKKKERD